jgi:predicted kinase
VSSPTLFLLCGLPGSGKSTRAKQILASERAVYITPDNWIVALGVSLVDYEFRFALQDLMLAQAGEILRAGASVVIEFGSWSVEEREAIRDVAAQAGAATELNFLDAPLDELVRRVRERGGPNAEELITTVLLATADQFEKPESAEIARFDRFVGPAEEWQPATPA